MNKSFQFCIFAHYEKEGGDSIPAMESLSVSKS